MYLINDKKRKNTDGFSLIEVLIATAVLLVITLMISNIFDKATAIWDNGYASADGNMAMRTVVGMLKKDLSAAVDGRLFGIGQGFGGDNAIVSGPFGSSLKFVMEGERNQYSSKTLYLVEYQFVNPVTRTITPIYYNIDVTPHVWDLLTADTQETVIFESYQSSVASQRFRPGFSVTMRGRNLPASNSNSRDGAILRDPSSLWGDSAYVLTLTIKTKQSFGGVQVLSYGPNGVKDYDPDKSDDIEVR